MKVFHVKGKDLKEVREPYEFLDGDVYLIDNSMATPKKVFVWLGERSGADEKAVGAWAAKVLDMKDEEIDIDTEPQGSESDTFKGLVPFNVKTGDTPGFLRHVDMNRKDYTFALFRIRDVDLADGSSSDDIVIEKVPIHKDSLVSDDVFVLDGGENLFVWVGSQSQVGEKVAGDRLARKFDVERKRTPMIYHIREGEPEELEFLGIMKELAKRPEAKADERPKKVKEDAAQVDLKKKKKPFWKFWG